MINKDFIQALSRATNTSAKDTTKLVDSFLQLMADKLDDQNVLNIPNVGSFEVKKKTERIVVSPVTKKRKLVPPKLVLTFRAASNLKDKLKTNSADYISHPTDETKVTTFRLRAMALRKGRHHQKRSANLPPHTLSNRRARTDR